MFHNISSSSSCNNMKGTPASNGTSGADAVATAQEEEFFVPTLPMRLGEVCEDADGGLRLLWQEHVEAKPPVQFEQVESTDEVWSMFDDSDSD